MVEGTRISQISEMVSYHYRGIDTVISCLEVLDELKEAMTTLMIDQESPRPDPTVA